MKKEGQEENVEDNENNDGDKHKAEPPPGLLQIASFWWVKVLACPANAQIITANLGRETNYSGSKNCPNVCLLYKDTCITQC